MTRVAFVAGPWIVGTVASVPPFERLAYLAAQSLARNGPLGSGTLRSDRPHGVNALVEVVGLHAGSSARLRWKTVSSRAECPAGADPVVLPAGDRYGLDRVTVPDELATGRSHAVLRERGPTRDDSRVVGVTRRTSAQCAQEIGELTLVEPEISEELRFRGRRRTHRAPSFTSPEGCRAREGRRGEPPALLAPEHRSSL